MLNHRSFWTSHFRNDTAQENHITTFVWSLFHFPRGACSSKVYSRGGYATGFIERNKAETTLSMQGLQITDSSSGVPLLVCIVGRRTRVWSSLARSRMLSWAYNAPSLFPIADIAEHNCKTYYTDVRDRSHCSITTPSFRLSRLVYLSDMEINKPIFKPTW